MGLHNLSKISTKLMEVGKPKDYPCAVISRGTTKDQSVVVGTLQNIVEKANMSLSYVNNSSGLSRANPFESLLSLLEVALPLYPRFLHLSLTNNALF